MAKVLAVLSSGYKDEKIVTKQVGGEKNYLPQLLENAGHKLT